jgi:hypothetical protein
MLAQGHLLEPLRCRPIFEGDLPQEPVSAQARRRDIRLPDYTRFTLPIGMNVQETKDTIELLELLECTHGAAPVVQPLPLIQLALTTAIQILMRGLTDLAAQRMYPKASLFVGALIEDEIERVLHPKKLAQRRAPSTQIHPRSGSPNLDFEDFLLAARMLCELEGEPTMQVAVRRTWGLACVSQVMRQHLSSRTEQALMAQTVNYKTWSGLITNINKLLAEHRIPKPPTWQACYICLKPKVAG